MKVRGLKRQWNSMLRHFDEQIENNLVDEAFLELGFSDFEHRRISLSKNQEILTHLIKGFERKSLLVAPKPVIGWINLNRLSESSIFIYDSKEALNDFLLDKKKNPLSNFYLRRISLDERSKAEDYLITTLLEDFPNVHAQLTEANYVDEDTREIYIEHCLLLLPKDYSLPF